MLTYHLSNISTNAFSFRTNFTCLRSSPPRGGPIRSVYRYRKKTVLRIRTPEMNVYFTLRVMGWVAEVQSTCRVRVLARHCTNCNAARKGQKRMSSHATEESDSAPSLTRRTSGIESSWPPSSPAEPSPNLPIGHISPPSPQEKNFVRIC